LSRVDRFLPIESHKNKTPHSSKKRGFINQTILPSCNVKGFMKIKI
jgi:hypothetical protein